MAYCGQCGAENVAPEAYCRACGAPQRAPPATPPQAPPAVDLGRPIDQTTAVIALLLNVFVWPGLGSLVGGESIGWVQGFLNLLGLVLILTIVGLVIGIPLMIAMWVWGIVTGAELLRRANAQQQSRLAR